MAGTSPAKTAFQHGSDGSRPQNRFPLLLIMRLSIMLEHDRPQNRFPLLLIML
jgi:hypothetical protein